MKMFETPTTWRTKQANVAYRPFISRPTPNKPPATPTINAIRAHKLPILRTGQGDFTKDYNPPARRVTNPELWTLAMVLAVVGGAMLYTVLKWNGVL